MSTAGASAPVAPFDYRIDWRPSNRHPGDHVAVAPGDGGAFRGERLLSESTQFRRLAIRSRLRDPLGRWWVHDIQQRSAIDLVVLADVSASMRIDDGARMAFVADLVESAALSAHRIGDRIGVCAGAARIDPALCSPPARDAARLRPIAARLRRAGAAAAGVPPEDGLAGIEGLRTAWQHLPARRSLVLLVSDFLAPATTWDAVLSSLAGHQVVPLVLARPADREPAPRFGLLRLTDAETGAGRVLWMRPALARRIAQARAAHGERISDLMARHHLRPLRVRPPFDPIRLTTYFLSLGGARAATPPSRPPAGAAAAAAASR